jgi:hypothetical protein
VTGFGKVQDNNHKDDDDTVNDALSVYLTTLLFGIKAAKKWLDFKRKKNKWPHPNSVSGKHVVIGKATLLELTLRASATIGKFPNSNHHTKEGDHRHQHWYTTQSEIFTGRLNVCDLNRKLSDDDKSKWIVFTTENKKIDVVVKVFSQAVHKFLTDPNQFILALTDFTKDPLLVSAIKVLLAVYHQRPIGLITVMADLSKEGYQVLQPESSSVALCDLWKGFSNMVNRILVPLAVRGCIHPDIRPGYDVTSNILGKVTEEGRRGNSKSKTVIMQVIDYESILHKENWKFPREPYYDYRYVDSEDDWNALMFLWWQCANVAHSWNGGLSQREMKGLNIQKLLQDESWRLRWFNDVHVPTETKLNEDGFKAALKSLGKLFGIEA